MKLKLRERPFIERVNCREHLPPPPLGKSLGHGVLGELNGSSRKIKGRLGKKEALTERKQFL